jgi:hypothetical protein
MTSAPSRRPRSSGNKFFPAEGIGLEEFLTAPDWSAFRDPPALCWPGYFWLLNDKLSKAGLRAQLREMRDRGARSLCLHPMPREFRPDTMGPQLDPPYLSRRFFDFIKFTVAECARLGLHYWLYDEGGWPSGSAAGRVCRKNPGRFACKRLTAETVALEPNRAFQLPADILCAVAGDGPARRLFKPVRRVPPAKQAFTLRLFRVERLALPYQAGASTTPYVDVLCRAATETFLKLTHDRYAAAVGKHFGKTIRFAFTDEPAAAHSTPPNAITWTDDLPRAFRARKGYALLPHLPELFQAPRPGEAAAGKRLRIDFYDVWSGLLAERYLAPIRKWCRAHGLLSAGHFGGEDEPQNMPRHGYGHILRVLRGLDLPGVDAIWRQIFPGRPGYPFPLYAASVAAQQGQPYVFSESFAVYGAGVTPDQMKWITDYQYALGANLMVISNYPYSTRDHFLPMCRPQFGPGNPLWKHLDLYHAATARKGYLLSRGRPECATAVYFDIRSIWAGGADCGQAMELHQRICRSLLAAQRAFHFIDDDLLAGRGSRLEKGALTVGPMRYTTLVIPACRWMEPAALRGLLRFLRQGGTVLAAGGLPSADGGGMPILAALGVRQCRPGQALRIGKGIFRMVAPDQLAPLLPPLVKLDPPCPALRVTKRAWPGGAGYFIFNEADRALRVSARFREKGAPVLADPEDGKLRPLSAKPLPNGTAVELRLAPWESDFIVFGAAPDAPAQSFHCRKTIPLRAGWRLRPLRAYRAGERDYEMVDRSAARPRPAELGDWRRQLGEHFSGDAEYSIVFRCAPTQAGRPARLDLGDVRYACEVILNGKTVGRRAWRPFGVDLGTGLRAGRNELRIIVTNTFANAVLDPTVRARWQAKLGKEWPVKSLCYDSISAPFEKESLPSGLFGPVRLRLSR